MPADPKLPPLKDAKGKLISQRRWKQLRALDNYGILGIVSNGRKMVFCRWMGWPSTFETRAFDLEDGGKTIEVHFHDNAKAAQRAFHKLRAHFAIGIGNEDYNTTSTHNCPLCNGAMSLKQGQYGQFWGCIAYPECVGIVKMDGKFSQQTLKALKERERLAAIANPKPTARSEKIRKKLSVIAKSQ